MENLWEYAIRNSCKNCDEWLQCAVVKRKFLEKLSGTIYIKMDESKIGWNIQGI